MCALGEQPAKHTTGLRRKYWPNKMAETHKLYGHGDRNLQTIVGFIMDDKLGRVKQNMDKACDRLILEINLTV